MFDWNDLRHFLEVARRGSTLAAARELGVSQTTTARRIAALEQALEVTLFERRQAGYRLTEAGRCVFEAAERVEAEAAALLNCVSAMSRRVGGAVRVTTNQVLADFVLTPFLREFRDLYPEVRVDLIIDERRLSIARGEADVALRAGSRPSEARLVGRKLVDLGWSVFCSRGYADRYGIPACVEDLNRHTVIGTDGPLGALPAPQWLRTVAPEARIECRSNTLYNLVATVKSGLGIATLPCLLKQREPDLVQCLAPIPGLHSELWLITHEDLRNLSHIRAFMDFTAARIMELTPALKGIGPMHEPPP